MKIVYSVTAKSDFIGTKKTRAELFELTDNEVAVFRLTLPENEFAQLKEEAQSGFGKPSGNKKDGKKEGGKGMPADGFNPNGGEGGMPTDGFNFNEGGMPADGFNFNEGGFPDFGGDFQNFNFTEGGFPGGFNMTDGEMPAFGGFGDEDSFKTKNATLIVELNG